MERDEWRAVVFVQSRTCVCESPRTSLDARTLTRTHAHYSPVHEYTNTAARHSSGSGGSQRGRKKRADDKTKKNLESVTRYCKICSTISTKLVRRGKLIFSCNVCACAISVKDESLKSCVEISLGAIHLNSILIF